MKKRWMSLLTLTFVVILFNCQPVMAAPDSVKIGSDFVIAAYVKKDEVLARTYLSSNVAIPEIREDTPINRVTGLPSPKENTSVSIAYFNDGEVMQGRIAFIWELTVIEDKITDIKVVYDGTNPFMNESALIKEYETKNNVLIVPPSEFPFDITHVDGRVTVDNKILVLNYKNANLNGVMQIKIEPITKSLESLKGERDKFVTLKNRIKALYQQNNATGQLVFQHRNLMYSISIESEINEYSTVDNLQNIANLMLR
nr:hypothetical protein [Lysinibacillus timonensis]